MALFRQLAANPQFQSRLREEVNGAFDASVDEMDAFILGKLPYLDALVQEILRFMPPVPSGEPYHY